MVAKIVKNFCVKNNLMLLLHQNYNWYETFYYNHSNDAPFYWGNVADHSY